MDTRLQQAPPVTNSRRPRRLGARSGKPRSLPIAEWPASDRLGWAQACRPAQRLKRGGTASHLAPISQADIANRYGLYLDFLQRNERLDPGAIGVRNGLLIALLALHPIRVKNFAALAIADTFINIEGRWWLHIPSDDTKSRRVDERQVPEFITAVVNSYIKTHRPVLCRANAEQLALWVSSTTGRQLTTKNLGTLISKITCETVGVDVSPHLFRTAGASTAAVCGGNHPHLASALLNHRDPRVTDEHYNRAMSISAGEEYAIITQFYRQHEPGN
jgi:integrase